MSQNPPLKYPTILEWSPPKILLTKKDGTEYSDVPLGYGGFKFYKYESIRSLPFPAARFGGGTAPITVKDSIDQTIDNDIVITSISKYVPFLTSEMFFVIRTKNGKFYPTNDATVPTVREYSDGSSLLYWINEDQKLHNIDGPAFIDDYGCVTHHNRDGTRTKEEPRKSAYFINGIQYTKEEWLNSSDVKMNEALR